MGTQPSRNLYLQVGGNTDELARALKSAVADLVSFDGDAGKMLASVQSRFDQLGANDNPARALTRSFKSAFAEIQEQAKSALTLPTNKAGALSLDVKSAQSAAAAATAEAAALREIADAASRAVVATNGENEALRTYATSAIAAAAAREQFAAGLRDQAAVLADVQGELNAAGKTSANTADVVVAGHNRMSASGMIMQHVLRSTADSFNAGLPPSMIFGEQISRVGEALALSGQAGEESHGIMSKLGGFMAGTWGIAFTVATAVLAPFVAKLFEAKEAAKTAALGNDGLTEAQSTLGKMFDLTTGKLEHQNEMLRTNARLTATNLRIQAANAETESKQAFEKAGKTSWGVWALGLTAHDVVGSEAYNRGTRNARVLGRIGAQVQSGQLKPEDAVKLAEKMDYRGTGTDQKAFLDAIGKAASVAELRKTAADVDKTIDSGKLDPNLKKTDRKKPKVDHSAEKAANLDRAYQAELGTAQDRYAKAQLALSDTAEGRLKLELDELAAAKVQRDLEIDDQFKAKKINEQQAKKLKALNASTTADQEELARRKEQASLLQEQSVAEQHARDARVALLQIDLAFATTRKQRLAIEQELLAEAQAARRKKLQDVIDNPLASRADKTQADKDLKVLPSQDAAERAQKNLEFSSPLDAYKRQLKSNTDDMKDSLQGVAVDGLKGIEDGFVGIINGTKTVAQAFKDMAAQIISDLARIAIEKALVAVLGLSTGGDVGGSTVSITKRAGGGIIPAFAGGGINGLFSGIGGPTEDRNLVLLSDGEFVVNARATREHYDLLRAVNDNHLPRFAVGGMVGATASIGTPSFSAASIARRPANSNQPLYIDLRNAVMTEDLLRQMQLIAAASGGQALTQAVDHTNEMFRQAQRVRL